MAFWGIEVRPGKPYTHIYSSSHGRLRISQATLGDGKGTTKCKLQCNVGDKSPILLCNLIPNVTESCRLELEFEEYDDEVIFSVLGQRSVHLSGFYLVSGGDSGRDASEESYGEDIAETDGESGSYYGSEDDKYESDFIDDDDVEVFPSARRRSNVVIEEIEEDEKLAKRNSGHRRLKKKQALSNSDEDIGSQGQLVKSSSPMVMGSEEEDGFPISFSIRKKNTVKTAEGNEKSNMSSEDKKRKIDAIIEDYGSGMRKKELVDSSVPDSNAKLKKKNKGKNKKLLENEKGDDEENRLSEGKVGGEETDLDVGVPADKYVDGGKLEDKHMNNTEESTEEQNKEDHAVNNAKVGDRMDDDQPHKVELEKLPTDSKVEDSSVNPEATTESIGKRKKKGKKKIKDNKPQEGNGVSVEESAWETLDRLNASEETDRNAVLHSSSAAGQNVTKKKKKKSKIDDVDLINELSDPFLAEDKEGMESQERRIYGEGLVVEKLSMGCSDGKKASPGSKVAIQYVGKLKNGKIFDSSIGKKPFKFRLGAGQVIKGWDSGIMGMRIGDKRRLTIPPSMGYGDENVGKIPANSWLIFDVELVDIR